MGLESVSALSRSSSNSCGCDSTLVVMRVHYVSELISQHGNDYVAFAGSSV